MKNEFYVEVGTYLKSLREKKGYSLVEVGDRVGTSKVSIKRYEDGDRKIPLEMLNKLCILYGIDLNELFESFKSFL